MSDLIRREDAIKALWKALYDYEDKTEKQFLQSNELSILDWMQHRIFVQDINYIDRQTILELPSTEPERKKGEWVYDGIRGRFPACKCSICGHYENADWAILQGANFCPHCGADMRGKHE